MKTEITIIGRNSRLYSVFRNSFQENFEIIREYSHNEINDVDKLINPIVFAYDPRSLTNNFDLIQRIVSISEGRVVYISTSSVQTDFFNFYKYPRSKKSIENYILYSFNSVFILRIGIVPELIQDFNSKFSGKVKVTSSKLCIESLKLIFGENFSQPILDCYYLTEVKSSNFLHHFVLYLYQFLFKYFPLLIIFLRPLEAFLKVLGVYNYGYSFLSNYNRERSFRYINIGAGISALGTHYAAKSRNFKVPIIFNGPLNLYISKNLKLFTTYAHPSKFGLSNLWHGVISFFPERTKLNSLMQKEFERFYPDSFRKDLFLNGFSFIPFFPIRPKRFFKSYRNKSNEFLIKISENSDSILLITDKREIKVDRVFLNTGIIATIGILFKSQSFEMKNSKVWFDDHMVGNFGQIVLSKKAKLNQYVVFPKSLKGHYKKFFKIDLGSKYLLLTLRPAFGSMRDPDKSSILNSFFGRSTRNILFSLIKKLNYGLFLEALYNKFGITLFKTNKFNLVGHIEVKRSFCIDENLEIRDLTTRIFLSENEKLCIESFIKSELNEIESVMVLQAVDVSPGYHFSLNKTNNYPAFFKNSSRIVSSVFDMDAINIEHPTFYIYLKSYELALNTFKNYE